jgi:alpha-mannosidase
VRVASNYLNAARQLEVISGVTRAEVNTPTTRPSPPVGDSWTDSLEGTIGIATHHDGMSGTERQSVTNDYSLRMSESAHEVEVGVQKSLQRILRTSTELFQCNCNGLGAANCLNVSMCARTAAADELSVIVWNPIASDVPSQLIRIPVNGTAWAVYDAADNSSVPAQASLAFGTDGRAPLCGPGRGPSRCRALDLRHGSRASAAGRCTACAGQPRPCCVLACVRACGVWCASAGCR